MKVFITLAFAFGFALTLSGQSLKPHIGLNALPGDGDAICDIPVYLGDFDTSGYAVGDTVNDFTLYTTDDEAFHLAEALQNGRPKLIIAGSYTCPVFRNKIPTINNIVGNYGGLVDVWVVYTVEAHPSGDPSPYFGYENVTSQNQQDGVLIPQPQAYGERKALAMALLQEYGLNATLLLDGPCNEWWMHYGPAPVNATLVDANGLVVAKHGWFNQYPQNMMCTLDSLLGTTLGNCNTGSPNGSFTVNVLTADTLLGYPGTTLTAAAQLINTSLQPVYVEMQRTTELMPEGWSTAMCTDVCYSAGVSQANVLVAPGDTQSFVLYFFNDTAPGFATVKMGFRNANNFDNSFLHFFHVRTKNPAGVGTGTAPNERLFAVYPNPVFNMLYVTQTPVRVVDMWGRERLRCDENTMDLSSLPAGLYYVIGAHGIARVTKQ